MEIILLPKVYTDKDIKISSKKVHRQIYTEESFYKKFPRQHTMSCSFALRGGKKLEPHG